MDAHQFLKERRRFFVSQDVVEPITLVIEDCTVETVGSGEQAQEKMVLSFENCEKLLPLSNRNIETLSKLFGTGETDAWRGRTIALHCDRAGSFRGSVGSIRVRAPSGADADVAPDAKIPF